MGVSGYYPYPVIIRYPGHHFILPVSGRLLSGKTVSGKTVSGTSLISHIFFSEIKHHSATCWERGVTNC